MGGIVARAHTHTYLTNCNKTSKDSEELNYIGHVPLAEIKSLIDALM